MSELVTKPKEAQPVAGGFTPPHVRPALNGRKVAIHESPGFTESFRLLALNVSRLLGQGSPWAVVILSAQPREGRSTTAATLARALSQMAPPVILVDADPDGSGLADVVPEWHDGEEGWGGRPRLQFVNPWFPAGTPDTYLDRVQDAVQDALDAGAKVIIDVPACATSSAGFYLATSAAGVLYVTRPNATKDGSVHEEVRAQLDLLRARVLGVVVNEG